MKYEKYAELIEQTVTEKSSLNYVVGIMRVAESDRSITKESLAALWDLATAKMDGV